MCRSLRFVPCSFFFNACAQGRKVVTHLFPPAPQHRMAAWASSMGSKHTGHSGSASPSARTEVGVGALLPMLVDGSGPLRGALSSEWSRVLLTHAPRSALHKHTAHSLQHAHAHVYNLHASEAYTREAHTREEHTLANKTRALKITVADSHMHRRRACAHTRGARHARLRGGGRWHACMSMHQWVPGGAGYSDRSSPSNARSVPSDR